MHALKSNGECLCPFCVMAKIDKLNERIEKLENYIKCREPQPHKCPLCHEGKIYGSGNVFQTTLKDALGREYIQCNLCKGNGVIWG